MWKYFHANGTFTYYDKLQYFLDIYNSRLHRTIKMAPDDVRDEHVQHLRDTVYNYKYKAVKGKFKNGDKVRISMQHNIFAKKYEHCLFSVELFTIFQSFHFEPEYYRLIDENSEIIQGIFYANELLKVDPRIEDFYLIEKIIKKEGNRYLAKLFGMDKYAYFDEEEVHPLENETH